ncbi:hypothetical protein [Saccharopolyspora shandongensis]|uniref:hypothetical protein n=1 Tax=Saccharopolyspora shandongensis TaxID=418495 RepID=UPI0033CA5BEB
MGLWSYVDDNGVGIDDHRQIAADLFALDEDPMEAREFVREGLATLSRASRITRYTLDGRAYLYINGWNEHQKIDRPGKSRYPLPPADLPPAEGNETAGNQGSTGPGESAFARPSRGSREGPSTGTGEQRNRGTEEKASPRAPVRTGARARGPATLDELNTHAVKPDAYQLTRRWHRDRGEPYPTRTVRALSAEVDKLLADRGEPDAIRAALDLWHGRTGASPGLLPHLYVDAVKVRDGATGSRSQPPKGASARGEKVRGWMALAETAPGRNPFAIGQGDGS